MASESLDAFARALAEIADLQRGDPTPAGGVTEDPATARAIGRASVVLLSSHLERYVYAVNEQAASVLNTSGVAGNDIPEVLRLLHSRQSVEALIATGWERRA